MTSAEAYFKTVWNNIVPKTIKNLIESSIAYGSFSAYVYKSISPDAFYDIDLYVKYLEKLGYDVTVENLSVNGTPDVKLTISWDLETMI